MPAKGQPEADLAFSPGTSFSLPSHGAPSHCRCPPWALVGWAPPPRPHPESLQVQAESCGGLGPPAGGGAWGQVHGWNLVALPAIAGRDFCLGI